MEIGTQNKALRLRKGVTQEAIAQPRRSADTTQKPLPR